MDKYGALVKVIRQLEVNIKSDPDILAQSRPKICEIFQILNFAIKSFDEVIKEKVD